MKLLLSGLLKQVFYTGIAKISKVLSIILFAFREEENIYYAHKQNFRKYGSINSIDFW